MSANPKTIVTRLLAGAAIAVGAGLSVVAPAVASSPAVLASPGSQGSVPSEVARYAADPEGLLARLDDLFGVTTTGQGIEFDDTTAVGQLNRAWVFTADWIAGGPSDDPVELTNLWAAPVTIAEKPIGLATIWVNPATDAPDLADFDRSASTAAALMDVPAEAQLVRDEPRAAWFTLAEGQLTPLVSGDSGVDAPTRVTAYQRTFTGEEPPAAPGPQLDGLLGAGLVAGAAVLVVIVVLLLPLLRRRAGDEEPDDGLGVNTAAITLPTKVEPAPEPIPEPAPDPTPEPGPEPKPVAAPEPSPARKPRKPATPKPTVAEGASASEVPAAAKPAAAKSAAAKPAAAKSAAAKPVAAKSATAKAAAPKPAAAKPAAAKPAAPKKPAGTPTAAKPRTPKPPAGGQKETPAP